ncbi:MAG: ABC transporter substrate-binding protein [Clostridiales bacterium]|nr:ABC transporter substrate-binding protein [Clostridiales bacterium]
MNFKLIKRGFRKKKIETGIEKNTGNRSFVHRTVAFMLSLSLTGLLLAGCGSSGSSESSETGSTNEAVENVADSSSTDSGDLTTLRIGVMTAGQDHMIVAVGLEEGIFEKYGLDVEYTEFAAGINTVDAIVTGQVDVGMLADYAAVNRLGNTQDDTNLRIIAHFASSASSKLYVNPDEVTELSDLAGKGFVTQAGTVWDYWNAKTYEAAGIAEEDQNLIKVDSGQTAVGAVISGEGVAFWASGTNAEKLEEAGMEPLMSLSDLGIRTDQYFISSTDYLAEDPDTVAKFLEAIKETQEWMGDNEEESAQILEDSIGYPYDQFLENFPTYVYSVDLLSDTLDYLTDIKDWALSAGNFDKDYDVRDFVDSSIVKELYPDQVEE